MKRKIIAMLVITFAISSISVAPCEGAENNNGLEIMAGVSKQLIQTGLTPTTFKINWTTTRVNVRTQPDEKSEVVDTLEYNSEIYVSDFNDNWSMIYFNKQIYYINNSYIQDYGAEFKLYEVPYASNKTWMSYKSITNKSSKQYRLQKIAYTGKYGIRMINGRYCVALGSFFNTEIGQYFDLVLENGTVIPCIMADQKADIHTDSANIITTKSDCLSEFIVDTDVLNSNAKRDGTMSSCNEEWDSHVVQVIVYDGVLSY